MKKPLLLAVGGALAGVAVALAVFVFVLGGGDEVSAEAPTEPVNVTGKLGPHITLSDRVFNLLPEAGSPAYVKLQTVIEFETVDPSWEYVLHGCGDSHAAAVPSSPSVPVALVSTRPGAAGVLTAEASAPSAGPCETREHELLDAFEHEIGTGKALIEDAVTTIVTGHTASEIGTPEGKAALRAEIKAAVDGLIGEPAVHRVLFLNFITQ